MSSFLFTRGPRLSPSLKVLKRDNQVNRRTLRPHLSATFCVLKRGELEAEKFKIRRPHSSETLFTLK